MSKLYVIQEVTELLRTDQHFVVQCLRSHWLEPASPATSELDEADVGDPTGPTDDSGVDLNKSTPPTDEK